MKSIRRIIAVTIFSTSLLSITGFSDQPTTLPGDYTRVTAMADADNIRQYREFLSHLQTGMDPLSRPWLEDRVKPGSHCLEIGPGLGSMTHYMAQLTGDSGHIDALDNNPAFMAEIAALAPNITTIEGDIRDYPLEPNQYDVIYARCVIELLVQNDHQALFRKLAGSLKPGGHLVIESLVDELPENRLPMLKNRDKSAYDSLIKIYQQSNEFGYMDLTLGHQYPIFIENAGLKVDKAEKLQRMVRSSSVETEGLKKSLIQLRDVIIEHTGVTEEELNRIHKAVSDPDFSFFIPGTLFISSHKPVQ